MQKVTFEDFSYAYPRSPKALDCIKLDIPKGSFTVVTGPGGSGKTTLCLAIAGVVPHYFGGSLAGEVLVNGVPTVNSSMAELAERVGTVMEDYESQLVAMTVEEEVAFALENQGLKREDIARQVKAVLNLTGLGGLDKWSVADLSGGQKQRLVIAGVLAAKPDILVLDEPASALDPEGAENLYTLLGSLNQEHGITVVVVEHDLARVLAYANQFVLLMAGKLVQVGTASEVLTHMWQQQVFCEAVPPLWQLKLSLEATEGVRFADWKTEQQAIEELQQYLGVHQEGEYQSA
jgi:energy-coupling factor transport system ATP-binding protein